MPWAPSKRSSIPLDALAVPVAGSVAVAPSSRFSSNWLPVASAPATAMLRKSTVSPAASPASCPVKSVPISSSPPGVPKVTVWSVGPLISSTPVGPTTKLPVPVTGPSISSSPPLTSIVPLLTTLPVTRP